MIYSTTFVIILFACSGQAQVDIDPDCEIQQYWPNIYDCSKFYECNAAGEKQEKQCPDGTLWNQNKQTCDMPYSTDCSWTVTTDSTYETTTSSASTVDPQWKCDVEGEFFPDTEDCRGFYECKRGIKQHNYCTVPLLWNVNIEGCSTQSDCSQVVTTTEATTTTTSRCTNGDFKIDPKDCHQFYYCENNIWTGPVACPADLYWSEHLQSCVKKSESDC
ncbi:probable chitinase 10 [Diorhabda sublineata]|uniref:probable chitinase 10 n=1 Tax=Diorhabda sublineata TaxID=1163346 RepID=UPI0024E16414|nr:probable chitinase 10 [Diorhabda sublineata]